MAAFPEKRPPAWLRGLGAAPHTDLILKPLTQQSASPRRRARELFEKSHPDGSV